MSFWITRWATSLVFLAVGLAVPNTATATSNPVPFLNPLVPDATPPGGSAFTLTVSGTGFVSGSTVHWNGAPRATTFVSRSKLTAAILASDIATAGTATVTVASPGPGGGISNSQFFQVVNAATQQLYWTSLDVTNKLPITSPMLAGDFNNDGKLDIVGAMGEVVYVALGNGDGSFQKSHGTLGPIGSTITGLSVADVNGDGKLDVVLTGSDSSRTSFVAVMLGNGDGSFQAPVVSHFMGEHFRSRPNLEDSNGDGSFQAPVESDFTGEHFRSRPNLKDSDEDESDFTSARLPSRPILADFNGDGVLDLAYATATGIQTLLGHRDGTFHKGPHSPLSQTGVDVLAVGDFNHDGKLDLVVSVYDPSTTREFIGVMLGKENGGFGKLSRVPGTETSFPSEITAVVADFNRDDNLDIATGIQTAGAGTQGSIRVSLGKGDGTFQEALAVPNVRSVTAPMLLGDFNGDGNLDLVTGGFAYFGADDGRFPTFQGSATALPLVVAGDFNGDGKLDILNQEVFPSDSTVLSRLGLYLQTPPQPDWTGYVAQQDQNVSPGASATYTIVSQPLNGFTGDISLTVSGLPPGATASFSPAIIAGGSGSSILTVQTASATPQPGIYPITVTGKSGMLVHNTTVYLGVRSGTGNFAGSVAPSQATVSSSGGSVSYGLTISPLNGGAGDIKLTASGMPGGATAEFNPSTIEGSSGNSTLTVTVGSGTPPGSYQIVITATGTGVIHQSSVTLTVTP